MIAFIVPGVEGLIRGSDKTDRVPVFVGKDPDLIVKDTRVSRSERDPDIQAVDGN